MKKTKKKIGLLKIKLPCLLLSFSSSITRRCRFSFNEARKRYIHAVSHASFFPFEPNTSKYFFKSKQPEQFCEEKKMQTNSSLRDIT